MEETVRMGWEAELRYTGDVPLVRVFHAAVPQIGESVALVLSSGVWWYRSSTGVMLAPVTQPTLAAQGVSWVLLPYVVTALAGQGVEPLPSWKEAAVMALQGHFTGVLCLRGHHTADWWARRGS